MRSPVAPGAKHRGIRHLSSVPEPDDRQRVLILGSGWGGYTLSRHLSPAAFNPLVISPRSYFVFTPLLTDAASGSLDFSHIVEPVRDPGQHVDFLQAAARSVDFAKKTLLCESTVVRSGVTTTEPRDGDEKVPDVAPRPWERGKTFEVPYDKLVIAVGAVSRTFDTPGVRENAMFFRDIGDARRVRRRVRECFELAAQETAETKLQRSLLHFAIIGAGATGCELAASLSDFINKDLIKLYPSLKGIPRITLYDISPTVLPMFDESLAHYAMETMKTEGITIKTSHHVESLRWGCPGTDPPHPMDPKGCLTLKTKEEGEEGVGICVWATGNEMNPLIRKGMGHVADFPSNSAVPKDDRVTLSASDLQKSTWSVKKSEKTGALLVDDHFHVQLINNEGKSAVLQDVFAIGDNATPESGALPATAQVTYQEAKWLAKHLNRNNLQQTPAFSFKNLGVMAYIGDSKALVEAPQGRAKLTGRTAWLVWKSAYMTMSMSWRNKLRVGFRWFLNWAFGRDISRY
ncbi:probable pyridine nucleotide-disulphide oxidoreductase [Cephalotrichum gorgonifer]|uniref:Probable pyridine nucleotide-disulphide oxidoreductase n=1 Tax=Cephalotrichum gorgonifer TaxID=2041049 RepID=A0AAE8N7E6_9PEZI|nr:probable pyridine nucleotide-disulphide oxidoreductase [Cephalotrichum gorgonifer]